MSGNVSNGNGTTTVRWIAIIVGILLFAGTVAFGAVQASMNAQLSSRVKKIEENSDEISEIKGEVKALSLVVEEKFKNIKENLDGINKKLDKMSD